MNFLWAIALLVLSAAIQMLITPKPKTESPKAAAFEDFDFPQTEEGTAQAVLFGEGWTKDWHILWYGNYRTSPITKKSGGKK